MNNKTKCLIKDLELQIDFLIGYQPSGQHWKQEYYQRKTMIDNTLSDENTPKEIIEKINLIQDSIYKLRNKETHKQNYIHYALDDYKQPHQPIKVRHLNEEWYI
jgi:hypothetical protein